MKILIFEYITGGGFNREELPESLGNEGRLMLQSLLDGFSAVGGLELTLMLDWRLAASVNTHGFREVVITRKDDCLHSFEDLAGQSDAVWPIAPESGGILPGLCRIAERLGKTLLTSPSSAVAVTGDKFLAYRRLCEHEIAAVPTRILEQDASNFYPGENIVKPVDGIGCEDSYVLLGQKDRGALPAKIEGKGGYIVQPHLAGKKTSLSCLFKNGRGWLLSVNLQKFELVNNQYRLSGIIVNAETGRSHYLGLTQKLAGAFPDLWGYAGIDLIETPDQILVLEINPRLTTSAAGLDAALDINLAQLVLQLLDADPAIRSAAGRAVALDLNTGSS